MKTGLFFGSFNPIHLGHLIVANYMVEYSGIDELWFIISPHNPLKNTKNLLDEYERLDLLKLAIADNPKLVVNDIEFSLPRPSYTIDTLKYLEEQFPYREWVLVMGTDTVKTLPKWKNYEQLISDYKIYAYSRPGFELGEEEVFPNLHWFKNVPLVEVSATFIRHAIEKGKSIKYLVQDSVIKKIEESGQYLKK